MTTQAPGLRQQLTDVQTTAQQIIDAAKSRSMTAAEISTLKAKTSEAIALKKQIEEVDTSQKFITDLQSFLKGETDGEGRPEKFLALSGASARTAAKNIADRIHETHGSKALTVSGAITTPVPMSSQSPVQLGRVPTSILDVLTVTKRETPSYRYLRQNAFTNNAAIVAPGATKPTSVIGVETVDGALQVFAHLSEPVDKFLLLDNDTLVTFIAGQLLWGLQSKVQSEVVNGTGATGRLRGILSTTGVQEQTFTADKVTTLRAAATKLEVLGFELGAYILNPNDWAAIETARVTSGTFDLGGPIDQAQRKVWGGQVITSPDVPVGTAFALDLTAVGVDVGAEGVAVEWDASGALFEKNQVRARVEGRFGISVYRPAGIVKINLTTP